jgi:diacylglycerol kinase family enzyme
LIAQENFAVVLNANARRVSTDVREKIERIVSPEHIYYSHTQDESRDITREIVKRGYPTVFTGGGDGTFVNFVNDFSQACGTGHPLVSGNQTYQMPNIGVLHLGTGNAVASIVSSGNFEVDLKSYVNSGYRDCHALYMVEAEGMKFPFGGMGWDGELLNDYIALKTSLGSNRLLKPILQNVGGYFTALFARTVPRHIREFFTSRPKTNVRVTNLGQSAHLLYRGEAVKSYGVGDVLYDGPMTTTMFGTLPYYGHGMTVLPYAMTRPGFFNLRVSKMSLPKVLSHLRSIWKGTYHGDDIADWHCSHIKIEYDRPMPYQLGGDAQGWRTSLEVRVSPQVVNLLRFI